MNVSELRNILQSMNGSEEIVFSDGTDKQQSILSFHLEHNRVVLRNHLVRTIKTEFIAFDGTTFEVDAVGIQYQILKG